MRSNNSKAMRVNGYRYVVDFAIVIFAASNNDAVLIRNSFFTILYRV